MQKYNAMNKLIKHTMQTILVNSWISLGLGTRYRDCVTAKKVSG